MKVLQKQWILYLLFTVLIAIGIFFLTYKLPLVSATYDEGFSYLANGEYLVKNFRWDRPYILLHPPLVYYLHGWIALVFPTTDIDIRLLVARLSLLPIYILFALVLFWRTRKWYGVGAAFFVLTLYLFSPEILSHARFITPDHLLSFMMFVTFMSFIDWLQQPSKKHMFIYAVLLGLTFLTKYTALLLVPLFIFLLCIYAWKKKATFVPYCKQLFIILALALYIVHAGYLFRESGKLPEKFLSRPMQTISSLPLAKPVLTIVFPRAYLEGVDFQLFESGKGVWWGYFHGEYYLSGLWYFYPAVFFIKTPLPLLGCMILAFWLYKRGKQAPLFLPLMIVFTVLYFFIYFMFFNKLLIGLRYLLPIYPLLFLFVAPVANLKIKNQIRAKLYRLGLSGFLIWYVWGSMKIAPHYLAYANESIGGPKNLWKYVADSNLDWNQDQKFIAAYLTDHPEIVKVNPHAPTTGLIAVNVNDMNLYYFYDYEWLRKLHKDPIDYVGYTWLIFDIQKEDIL